MPKKKKTQKIKQWKGWSKKPMPSDGWLKPIPLTAESILKINAYGAFNNIARNLISKPQEDKGQERKVQEAMDRMAAEDKIVALEHDINLLGQRIAQDRQTIMRLEGAVEPLFIVKHELPPVPTFWQKIKSLWN